MGFYYRARFPNNLSQSIPFGSDMLTPEPWVADANHGERIPALLVHSDGYPRPVKINMTSNTTGAK